MNNRILFKSTSARFLMASITTVFACVLTVYVVIKYPEGASQITTNFFTVWASIVAYYFGSRGVDKNVVSSGDQK